MKLSIYNETNHLSHFALLVWLFSSIFILQAVPPVLARTHHYHGNLSRCPARLVTTKTITVTRSTVHATPIPEQPGPDADTRFDAKSRNVTITTTTTTKFILKTKTVNKDRFHTASVDREKDYSGTTQNQAIIDSASRYTTLDSVDSDIYTSSASKFDAEEPTSSSSSSPSPVDTLSADSSPSPSWSWSSSSLSATDIRTQVTSYAPSSSSSSSSSASSSSTSTSSLIIASSSLSPASATPPLSAMQTCEISVYTYAPASECSHTYNTVGACGLSTYFPETMSSKLPRLAVPMALFDQYGASQHNSLCGKTVTIKGANGHVGKAIIADRNAGTSFDLCMDLWTDLGYTSGGGRFAAQYVFD